MDPEIEKKINAEIESMYRYFMWRMRDIAGEWPVKLRLSIFFSRPERRHHMVESETVFSNETLTDAEGQFIEAERKKIVDEARAFMKSGGDSNEPKGTL